MDLAVDVEGKTIFLEGANFLIPLDEQQAHQVARWLEDAALQARQFQPPSDNDRI